MPAEVVLTEDPETAGGLTQVHEVDHVSSETCNGSEGSRRIYYNSNRIRSAWKGYRGGFVQATVEDQDLSCTTARNKQLNFLR